MNHLKDITVLVLGLGESGLAMARWCARDMASKRAIRLRRSQVRSCSLLRPNYVLQQTGAN